MELGVPDHVRAAKAGRPHELKVAIKRYFEGDRLPRADLEANDGAIFVGRHQPGLANVECV